MRLISNLSHIDARSFADRIRDAKFKEVEAIILLGHKYDTPTLYNKALGRLFPSFPTTLAHWDTRDSNHMEGVRLLPCLHIARKINYLSSIPAIMLAICSRGIDVIVAATVDPEDLKIILPALWKLQARHRTDLLRWLYAVPQTCHSRLACLEARLSTSSGLDMAAAARPIIFFTNKIASSFWDQSGLCKACVQSAKSIYGGERTKLWNDLPAIFGLPSWEDLRVNSDSSVLSSASPSVSQ
jgi:hypothetical protein